MWLYLIGIIVMFGILITATTNFIIPFFNDRGILNLGSNFETAPEFEINTNLDYYAKIDTNFGSIEMDLFEKSAPNNTNNFVYLSEKGYYTRTKFHRLFADFLLQGGDRNTLNSDNSDDGKGRPGYLLNDEINWDSLDLSADKRTELTELGYSNTAGIETPRFARFIVGLANSGPNTNGSQFFILINNSDDTRVRELDGKYTPLGRITVGEDILANIAKVSVDDPTSNSPRPQQDIVIDKVTIFTR